MQGMPPAQAETRLNFAGKAAASREANGPRAAYVHVPFCRHRCGYCNFTVVAGAARLVEPYLEALALELSTLETPREVDTLFVGGGTPTELDPAALSRLLALVAQWFPLADGGEWTVEANPSDLTHERVARLAAAGVNRVSLGVQSFNAKKLSRLERDHTADDIRAAADIVRRVMPGAALAIDLIFAAPAESLADWSRDLDAALALDPEHISTYGLTFERGTSFWSRRAKGTLKPVDEERERVMYLEAIDRLTGAGFEHYEVSNFARPGHRCRHNECYWSGDEYWAAGPGAARYVSGERQTNHRSTTTWIKWLRQGRGPVAFRETLDAEDRAREALVFGLRRLEGIDESAFAERFGHWPTQLGGRALAEFVAQGWLERRGGWLRLTRAGLLISDGLWPGLLRC